MAPTQRPGHKRLGLTLRKSLADIEINQTFSPSEAALLDLPDTWDDVLRKSDQSTSIGGVASPNTNSTQPVDDNNNTAATLRRLLSLNPAISIIPLPSPSPSPNNQQQEFHKIGAGQCGAVFSTPATETTPAKHSPQNIDSTPQMAYKLAKVSSSSRSSMSLPGQEETNLWNDYKHHTIIREQFRRFLGDHHLPYQSNPLGSSSWNSTMGITIPDVYYFVSSCDAKSWMDHPSRRGLAAAAEKEGGIHHPLPTDILVTERIYPLPKEVRDALIDGFFIASEEAKQAARNDPANSDCLVRVYLGSNKEQPPQQQPSSSHSPGNKSDDNTTKKAPPVGSRFFSLRNFKLHLNQLIQLDLHSEIHKIVAKQMGQALAIMHWACKTDARDVEFVLGSSRERVYSANFDGVELSNMKEPITTEPPFPVDTEKYGPGYGETVRSTQLWVLDFNQCRRITFTQEGVEKMVEAVGLNDPYFPRPLRETCLERAVWSIFARAYLASSRRILEEVLQEPEEEENQEIGTFDGDGRKEQELEMDKDKILELPRRFIMGLVELERGRIERRERKKMSGEAAA